MGARIEPMIIRARTPKRLTKKPKTSWINMVVKVTRVKTREKSPRLKPSFSVIGTI